MSENRKKIITLEDIGIEFSLKGDGARNSIGSLFSNLFKKKNSFWALKNINLDILEGEVLYIIGRNGAGKTTLLKVLAETLHPDSGTMIIYEGKTSFVSMGLGFRPDLSGYENMKNSLLIMGVDNKELKQKIDEILEFTQLEQFIYEPVANYSAGMKSRLGFAIATSIKPDILIMDEVINAGDEVFRERCKERMEEMLKSAKCVIVCSHNLQSVEALATKVLWIEKGEKMAMGETKETLKKYREFIKMVRNDPFYDKNRS